MQVRLIVQGKNRRVLKLTRDIILMGRAKGCAIRIPSAEVSRRHCRLVQKNGFLLIEDLGSVNGTLLNDELVRGQQAVRPGDKLAVGPLHLLVAYELTADARIRLEAFAADVQLVGKESSGPDFLEDDGNDVEWLNEGEALERVDPRKNTFQLADEKDSPTDEPLALGDRESWAFPSDLQLRDLLEPYPDDDEHKL